MSYVFRREYPPLPDHMEESLRLWINHGRQPGHFLTACIENDLVNAAHRADSLATVSVLPVIMGWMYNEAPSPCWGSREKRLAWEARFDDAGQPRDAETAACAITESEARS